MGTKPPSADPAFDNALAYCSRNIQGSTDEELVAIAGTSPEKLARATIAAAEARLGRQVSREKILASARFYREISYALEAIALIERAPSAPPADKPS